jgi:hypothetical protein
MQISDEQRTKLRKLVTLANFLDDLPHDRFHMPSWAAIDATTESCGTAGCACGWAATVFQKDGWTLMQYAPLVLIPKWGEYVNEWAFALFFGIRYEESAAITVLLGGRINEHERFAGFATYVDEYGLTNESAITPRHAADRIRKVVARYDASLLEDKSKPAGVGRLVEVTA